MSCSRAAASTALRKTACWRGWDEMLDSPSPFGRMSQPHMRRFLNILVIVVTIAGARTASAQYDFVGVRALGQGEAMRATPTGGEAVLLNPAGMSLIRQYAIEADYGINIEQLGHH